MNDLTVGRTDPSGYVDDSGRSRLIFTRARSSGARWAEIFHEIRIDASVTLASGGASSRSASLDSGIGLRVAGPDGVCRVFGSDEAASSVLDLADRAAAGYAAMGGQSHRTQPPSDPADTGTRFGSWVDALDLQGLALHSADALAGAESGGTDGVRVRATTWTRTITVLHSEGTRHRATTVGTRLAVDAFARRGGDRRKGRANHCSVEPVAALTAAQAVDVGRRAADQGRRLLGTSTMAPAELPVVLAPRAAGLLVHELLGHPCEADMVAAGNSPVHRPDAGAVTDACITVHDGCGDRAGWGVNTHDDEGNPNPRTLILDRGRAGTVLSDRRSTEVTGNPATGNGRRQSYAHPVLPRVSRTCLQSGTDSPDALVAGLDTGLWVLAADGGAVNARTGMLTVDVKEARMVRGGCPAEWVSGIAITGGAREVLRRMRSVGDDPEVSPMICGKHGQWIPVSAHSPSVLIERMQTMGG